MFIKLIFGIIYNVNVDLLRKLSPSTWCTSGSMTEHYVENYDNYLLIVDGITVAGIEAYPESKNDNKTFEYTIIKEDENQYIVLVNGEEDNILPFTTEKNAEDFIKSQVK